jgi:hypothetical protein
MTSGRHIRPPLLDVATADLSEDRHHRDIT